MRRQEPSREELFALVWEKPTRQVAKELGVSDVAIGKLCERLQVPKPPRGYWARVHSGQTPRRPPLAAFREEVDRKRREAARERAAGTLSKLQIEFYRAALSDLKSRDIDVEGAEARGNRLPELAPDIAAQILLLIQNRRHDWVEQEKVTTTWGAPAQSSVIKLVEKLLPLAQPQLLVFESEGERSRYSSPGPVVFVRLTAPLQERIATLVRIVRDQRLQHVVVPLIAADHAWSARYAFGPESRLFLDSMLCVSTTEIWVESTRKAWREEDPPERLVTNRMRLDAIMPTDCMPVRDVPLSPVVSGVAVAPYRKRLDAFREVERVYEMVTSSAYAIEREVPDETLAIADRLWFGPERPFLSAREAWRRLDGELERWDAELEAERSTLAQDILGIQTGDIVAFQNGDQLSRLFVTGIWLHASDDDVLFIVRGRRFRKDGTLGKREDSLTLRFKDERQRK